MSLVQMLLKEMDRESIITRKMLALVPADKLGWKPHEKSMTLGDLATHITELPSWVKLTLETSELDFSKRDYARARVSSTEDLLELYEKSSMSGRSALEKASDEDLEPMWTLRNGEEIYSVTSKADVIRMSYNQTVHHRAQLGVFLRLLNIEIPGSYGPSADDPSFS